jgi:nucleoside-diphosphate-sugar epimerase
LPVAVLRPFNTYGPRQSARAVIPTIISQLLAGREKISLGAVSPTRDFNFVADMVSAFIAIAEAENTAGEVVNAGTGFEISIGEVADLLGELVGKEVEIKADEQRIRPENSEVNRLCASNEKIRRLTGWQPELSGLDGLREGLRRTVDWFSRDENLKLYKSGEYNI